MVKVGSIYNYIYICVMSSLRESIMQINKLFIYILIYTVGTKERQLLLDYNMVFWGNRRGIIDEVFKVF